MGDRANVYVKESDTKGVYLYAHWDGHKLPRTVQSVLQKKERWDDSSYLTRMIFCAMVKGSEEGSTGYGISAHLGDNQVGRA